MSKIKVMDEILSNKIAAGEVVERCASVVKELVENSCDAKSSEITIELIDSGIKQIKVTDNGFGMDLEDAKNCFLRHATSKILDSEDLYRISTLGFRGEALPSIASVSDIVLKTNNGETSSLVHIKGGKIIEEGVCSIKQGSEFTVSNLFYNTPARLKHLSSLYAELAHVSNFISKVALANPHISFTLKNNNKLLIKTIGNGNLLQTINSVYGFDISKNMLEINCSNNDYEINGYIAKPIFSKQNKNHINIIVNNRIVRNFELNKIISDSYHTYLLINKYPIVVLNIKADPSLIDVNIHPTKMDIRFSKIDELKSLIRENILKLLSNTNHIKNVDYEEVYEVKNNEYSTKEQQTIDFTDFSNILNEEQTIYDADKKLPELHVAGSILGTYLICENNTGMYLIDQHAAKERINYELIMSNLEKKQDKYLDLLVPIKIELPSDEYIILKENLYILENMMFIIEEFGYNTVIIKSHPIWLNNNVEDKIRKIIDIIISIKNNFNIAKFNESVSITLACKSSIKANDTISVEEARRIISDLGECKNPYTCPHGRPTIINFTKYEIEKMFKRIQN